MKFNVSSTLLYERLQTAAKFIAAKPSYPIYGFYLFKVEENTLTITASDTETTLITSVDIENLEGNGSVALQSRILSDVLKEFTEQKLTFNIDDHNFNVKMTTESGSYEFMGQNAADYVEPSSLSGDNVKAFKISGSKLSDSISKTLFAVANDEIRPIMNGICFKFDQEGLNIVATDGHRLSKVTLDEHPDIVGGFIFPQKPANLLKGVLAKEVGDVDVMYDDKFIVFTTNVYKMISRQIEGNYPAYNAVIPSNFQAEATVNREALLSVFRRIGVCSDQGTNLVKLTFTQGNVCVYGQDVDFAVSGIDNLVCSYNGEPLEIGFKVNLLIDLFSNLSSDDVLIRLVDQTRPGIFIPVQQKEGESVLMLAMPMMIP